MDDRGIGRLFTDVESCRVERDASVSTPDKIGQAICAFANDHPPAVQDDPHCLTFLQQYRSLMQLDQEARKPMFDLKPADGAVGTHVQTVREVFHGMAYKTSSTFATTVP